MEDFEKMFLKLKKHFKTTTNTKLSEKIGVSISSINLWIKNKRIPIATQLKIINAHGLEPNFFDSDDSNDKDLVDIALEELADFTRKHDRQKMLIDLLSQAKSEMMKSILLECLNQCNQIFTLKYAESKNREALARVILSEFKNGFFTREDLISDTFSLIFSTPSFFQNIKNLIKNSEDDDALSEREASKLIRQISIIFDAHFDDTLMIDYALAMTDETVIALAKSI